MRGLRPREGAAICYRWAFEADGDAYPVTVILDWTDETFPHVRIRHSIRTGDGAEVEYSIGLVRSRCRFGGWRWWWLCPASGARVFALFLPRGGRRFLSRRAYRLGYLTQRLSPLDRAYRAKAKIERRLWWHDDDTPCPAPGMRRRTFDRLVARWEETQRRLDVAWEPGAIRLLERLLSRR